ncbi:MAG: glycosyltransferase [Flavobacterium sp.]|uniref:glycosyltransferase n=1 Tax=Flavobacterium sp. TaxID=239 RepID=UPI0022C8191A|nr:glycosyltransferase [Flavobacterium sp.]MCZ8198617.1 glycosyltransferase [Flavobacterium sp.]
MKILYITPKANDYGGVAKILSVKASALAQNHQVYIATQNNGWQNAPYKYNASIQFFDMVLYGNKISFLYRYHKALNNIVNTVKPDLIFVSDNGLKAYLIPFLVTHKCQLVFEVRGSLYNEITSIAPNRINQLFHNLKYFYRRKFVKFYNYIVFLSKESQEEWGIKKKTFIIPNPIENITQTVTSLDEKIAICVARNSYEKGLDRLLDIWQLVQKENKEWKLKIIGVSENREALIEHAIRNDIAHSIEILPPTNDIIQEYLNASIYLMPSRSEGFPNVLLEAQSCGLPLISYNCPIGPKSMIIDSENGFLIPDGDKNEFAKKLLLLMQDKNLRVQMGKSGRTKIFEYEKEKIIEKWEKLIQEVTKSKV